MCSVSVFFRITEDSVIDSISRMVAGSNPWFWYQYRSPSRRSWNCSAMITPKVCPTIPPATWFSASPPIQSSTLFTSP